MGEPDFDVDAAASKMALLFTLWATCMAVTSYTTDPYTSEFMFKMSVVLSVAIPMTPGLQWVQENQTWI